MGKTISILSVTLLALALGLGRASASDFKTWDLFLDFNGTGTSGNANGIGSEGVWSYGDDVGAVDNLSGYTAFNQFSGGQWTFSGDPAPPDAVAGGFAGVNAFFNHEADHTTRANVVVWTAPREMDVAFSVGAWTPEDGIQDTRLHNISWRWYASNSTTLKASSSTVIGPGHPGATYATRWTSNSSAHVLANETLSIWHTRIGVQGYVGLEFKVTEVKVTSTTWTDLGTLGGASSSAFAVSSNGKVVGESGVADGTHAFLYANGSMTDLGTLGGHFSTPTGVNASGQVVGWSSIPSGRPHAFLYDGALTDLGTLGGDDSKAFGINASGSIVGESSLSSSGPTRAFLYSYGSMVDLGTLGGNASSAKAINDAGQITGWAQTSDGSLHAFRYENGTMTDLGTLGTARSEGIAINASGQVLATYGSGSNARGFVDSNGTATDIGTLGGTWTRPLAINANGDVVGDSRSTDGVFHAFLYTGGTMIDLGKPGLSSVAAGVNASGQVVGTLFFPNFPDSESYHAFLYHDGEMTDLGTLGGSFSQAFAINDAGKIAGVAAIGNPGHAAVVQAPDVTAPTIVCLDDLTVEATGAAGATVTYASPTAVDASDPSPTVSCTPASGSVFPLGATTVTCTATDASMNAASCTFTVTVPDTTAPSVSCPASQTLEATGSSGATATFAVSATDLVDGSVAVSCDHASGATFPVGATTVTCSATDAHDNTGTCSFTVTVVDTTAPAITCPASQTLEATGPSGAAATFTSTATDLVDGTVAVTCSPASGSTFPVGTTTVTCTATDAHGNTGTCQFTVTVVDTTAPALACAASQTLEATGLGGAAATFAVSATDLVDGSVAVTCSPASGSTFPIGTTTVMCSATDAHGNTGTCSFTVTVVDTTAPVLACAASQTLEATSASGATATFAVSATDLVDGGVAVTCDHTSGSTFPVGTTTVMCSATDAHGNTAACSFTVTVVDTTAPTISVTGVPATLWPPNHKLVHVNPTIATSDAVDGSLTVTVAVTSSEPDNGLGDGDTAGDIVVHSATDIEVRAERSATGSGRVYTFVWTVSDSHGNSSSVTKTVTVPRNQ